MRLPWLCLCVLLASPSASFAQTAPILVHDFTVGANQQLEGFPSGITRIDDRIFFLAKTVAEGDELWVSDGTQQGTGLVADVGPGSVGGLLVDPFPFPRLLQPLIPFGSGVAFASGAALWTSDGTTAGTRLVFEKRPISLLEQEGALYFFAPHDTDITREILHRSDGTREGTRPLLTVVRPQNSNSRILRLGGGLLLITEQSWMRSDGTTAGTQVICPSIASSEIATVGDAIFYAATTGQSPVSLRRLDAATGADTLVIDAFPGVGQTYLYQLFAVGEHLYFTAGSWFWSSDGTLQGTVRLAGAPSDRAIAVDGRVAISSPSVDLGGVWVTDGTAAGTRRVDPGQATDLAFQDATLFFARDSQLWRSDGTSNSSTLVVDLAPLGRGAIGNLGSGPDALYFSLGTRELWKSDGTAGGTALVSAIGAQVFHGNPAALRAFGDALIFRGPPADLYAARSEAALTSLGGRLVLGELNGRLVLDEKLATGARRFSLSDGTPAGTVPYTEITRNLTSDDRPFPLGEVSGRIVFAHKDVSGEGLWVTDGSAGGTGTIKLPFKVALGAFHRVTPGMIYFSRDDGSGFGGELMTTDGTSAGTQLVVDLAGSPIAGFAGDPEFATVGRVGYFRRYTPQYGSEVWRTDATPEGTQLLTDAWPGTESSIPGGFATAGSRLFFSAAAAAPGFPIALNGLFSTSLTGPTATLLRGGFDLSKSTADSVAIGDRLFLTDGSELWVSDGTPEGTLLTREIAEGSTMSRPAQLASIRGRAVFQACDPVSGCELWVSDGTASGTRRLTDLAPGPRSSGPEQITLVGQDLYFTATTPQTGRELFRLPVGECGDGKLGALEECDDGNTYSLDGCDRTCSDESVLKLFGAPEGGAFTLVVEGLPFAVATHAGESIAEILERAAGVLNGSSVLRVRGIRTAARGAYLLTTGQIESVAIQDPGLSHDPALVPLFPTPWAWVVLAASLAVTASRRLAARFSG